jgi:hypothetical protein
LGGCDNPAGGTGPDSVISTGKTFSGQIYTNGMLPGNYVKITDTKYDGKVTTNTNGGDGKIENGKMSVVIGTPSAFESNPLTPNDFAAGSGYTVTLDAADVKFAWLKLTPEKGEELSKEFTKSNADSIVSKNIDYIYVDKKVKITAAGSTDTTSIPGTTLIYKDFTITLEKDKWNALYSEVEMKTDSMPTVTYSAARKDDNDLHWVLYPLPLP